MQEKTRSIEREIMGRSKEITPKMKQRRLRAITLQGALEKSPILISQYWKNEWLDINIIISFFWGPIIFSPTVVASEAKSLL